MLGMLLDKKPIMINTTFYYKIKPSAYTARYVILCCAILAGCGSDSSQKATPPPSEDFIEQTYQNDVTPPLITNLIVTNANINSATISWTTDEVASSRIEYGISPSLGATDTNTAHLTQHSVTLTGLLTGTQYHYQIYSTDNSNNERASSILTFTTPSVGTTVGTWVAPIGIPAPSFGIAETAPTLPSPWSANEANFYYIKSGGTNSGNGYPGHPRGNVPGAAQNAGSVIVIEGEYQNAENNTFSGTIDEPVYIISSTISQAILKKKWVIKGSYVVMDGVNSAWDNASSNGKLLVSTANHIAIKNGDFRGDSTTGGVNVSDADNVVLFNNVIHDHGDVNTLIDQDVHGTSVGDNTSYLWILDSEYYHNSGNGIQLNGNNNDSIHHAYIGRNNLHENVQAGFGLKKARDIIISQNQSWGARERPWSGGNGFGQQYGPDYVWYLFNHVYDNEEGFRISSDSGGTGTEHFFIGNLIHNIHKVSTHNPGASAYNPENAWEKSAISVWGGLNTYVINNTIWDVDGVIYSPRGRGEIFVENNIIGNVTRGHTFNLTSTMLSDATIDYNLIAPNGSYKQGNTTYTYSDLATSFNHQANGFDSSTPLFVNPAIGDFHLQASSPAIAAASISHYAYTTFINLYGIDIEKDLDGNDRPQASQWSMGAYE